MRDVDRYRSMSTQELLTIASEEGIDPDMSIAMAERLERTDRWLNGNGSSGGHYTFNQRSIECHTA